MTGNVSQPAFKAPAASTVFVSAGTTSSNVQFQSTNIPSRHVRVYNSGSVSVFIEFGTSGVAATVPTATTPGSMVIAAGAVEIFSAAQPYMAGITSSGTATVYATPGEGQ